jgi:glycosyltransferase involved in cell wall biosynthesis
MRNLQPAVRGGVASRQDDPHLWVHGANLEIQRGAFQNEFRSLIDATKQNVTFGGQYERAELPRLMSAVDWVVVPSIWWENSPLVIQEAFAYGRPVVCSDVGGMAEKVTHGVNGLHFRVHDPLSLAETIRRAVSAPGLWQTLRNGIQPVYAMHDHIASLAEIYRRSRRNLPHGS